MSMTGVVTFAVGVALIGGGAWMYRSNEQPLVQKAQKAAIADMRNANASLPKWDNTHYKGLVYKSAK